MEDTKRLSKTDSRYWKDRVVRPTGGTGRLVRNYSVQMTKGGKRTWFALGTPDKMLAARRACEIFKMIVGGSDGWERAVAEFKNKWRVRVPVEKKHRTHGVATVGELLAVVEPLVPAFMRPSTFRAYSQALRTIASQVAKVPDRIPRLNPQGKQLVNRLKRPLFWLKSDVSSGGRDRWLAAVNEVSLAALSADAIKAWKHAYLSKAGNNPIAIRRAQNSMNSLLRSARALFACSKENGNDGRDALVEARSKLMLPDPLPFSGIGLSKPDKRKYQSKIEVHKLIADARLELGRNDLRREEFKIFVLGLFGGLRRSEIDRLCWDAVDLAKGVIRIEGNEFGTPKSDESSGVVPLDDEVVLLLREWKSSASCRFVVESDRAADYHGKAYAFYRCRHHFKALNAWLRDKIGNIYTPTHELRRELGSLVAEQHGIFAAMRALRHRDISTTERFYTDRRGRFSVGLGSVLANTERKPQEQTEGRDTEKTSTKSAKP